MTLALFERFPALARATPHHRLASLPTPVQPLRALPGVFVKRDDLTGGDYGGNKIRKLEFLLGAALRDGARTVLTLGFAGSNHAAATAVCARGTGLRSISVLLHQANSAYVRRNLLLGHAHGAELHACRTVAGAVARAGLETLRHRARVIPPGGSSPLGVLGFVNAGFELQQQVAAGALPEPERVYVALGSMGSAAGLALGLRASGLRTRVTAVRVVEPRFAGPGKLRALIERTSAMLRRLDPGFPVGAADVEVRDEQFGRGYGVFTDAARAAAAQLLREDGLRLDGTYAAKALAALVADLPRGAGPVLFWNTSNGRALAGEPAPADWRGLPPGFHRYFEAPGQEWIV